MPTYEELRLRVTALGRADTGDKRDIHWVSSAKNLGVSRTHENRLEIFLVGAELRPVVPSVALALEYGPWWHMDSTAPAFEANRLLLPAGGHFDEIVSFMCTELLRNGSDLDLENAFTKTEPILSLLLERLRLSDNALLGLAGELLLVDALCQRAAADEVALVVDSWDGWRQSFRDFTWGGMGVEIKTTQGPNSNHYVQGTNQVELYNGDASGLKETGLILLSVGLTVVSPHKNSFTMPMLVDRIIERLLEVDRSDAAEVFRARLREYGSGSGFGYDHRTMSRDAPFAVAFDTAFVRAYDMTDENISVLRRADVLERRHVDASSLSYAVNLPLRASGDLNPVVGMNQAAAAILGV